jgi:hypothetical protein
MRPQNDDVRNLPTFIFRSLQACRLFPVLPETQTFNMKKSFPKLLLLAVSCLSISGMLSGQKITSFAPATGPVGTVVTINGTGFGATPAANTVFFGTVKGVITEASSTQIRVKVPAGATYQPLSVQTGGLAAFSTLPFVPTFGCAGTFTASTLAPRVNYYAGVVSSPAGTATADLNGDGKPEIITSAQDINSLVIYENTATNNSINGSSFGSAFRLEAGEAPTGLAAADFNNDGKIDLVTTNFESSSISVFQNMSTGGSLGTFSFSTKIDIATVTNLSDVANSLGIAVGDLDGDGRIDITVANYNTSTVSVFRNTSNGGTINTSSFTLSNLATNITKPSSIVIADLNLDGKPDIVVNNSGSSGLTVLRNVSTAGTLNTSSFISQSPLSVPTKIGTSGLAAGDINGDGLPDLVLTNAFESTNATISLFRNTTSGSVIMFAVRTELPANPYPANVTISDITGDGKPDLIVGSRDLFAANSTANSPTAIYTNTNSSAGGALSFSAPLNYATGGSTGPLSVADLDADGKPELVVPNYYLDYVGVLKNTSSSYTGLAVASLSGSSSLCNDGVWKNISDPNDPSRIICSINDNGNDLGTITANLYVDPTPGTYQGQAYLSRHFVVKPTTQPTGNIRVRLYFTDAELNALQAADNSIISAADLAITKYQGPTEDGVFDPTDATSITMIPSQSIFIGSAFGARYAEFTVSSLSEFWLHSNAVALPVDIVSFDAAPTGEKVLLNWKVANEVNLAAYDVEKSTDGQKYAKIGSVAAGAPVTGVKSYSFADAFPSATNHYRLVQKDKDGNTKYSEVRVVKFQSSLTRVSIAPHPVTGRSIISIPATRGTTVFTVFDQRGMQLRTYNFQSNGSETIRLNFEKKELPAGTYFFQVTNGKTALQQGKLVIQ